MPQLKLVPSQLNVRHDDFYIEIEGSMCLWATYKPFLLAAQEINELAKVAPEIDSLLPRSNQTAVYLLHHRSHEYATLYAIAAHAAIKKSLTLSRELYAVSAQLMALV